MKPALIALMLCILGSIEAAAGDLRAQRFEFKQAVDRTFVDTGSCVPERALLRSGKIHAVGFLGRREPGDELTVEIKKDQEPIHLILYTTQEIIWNLSVEPGAQVETVYTVGPVPSAVVNVPDHTLVYSIGYGENNRPSRECIPVDETASGLAKALFRYDWLPANHFELEAAVKAYADQEIIHRVLIEPDTDIGIVSINSSLKSWRTRKAGEAVLRYVRLPQNERTSGEIITVPSSLSSSGIQDWLLDSGAATIAGDDILEIMCLREEAEYWAVGVTNLSVRQWCTTRAWWESSPQLVLTKSIDFGDAYICENGSLIKLYVPDRIEIKGKFTNCDISIVKFD
ncbi:MULTISPECIES: hypothetical protein [unclassified Ruegeria]|uniref:hypothetical protein n=1 Tax=unclassified Ruegeria TaxID=2625375 RepID=UPI001AD9F144|nr:MULTISPECIES: hypothetical protein [unclassified Ruegeria]MBO9411872.1 hypothetical protein [Ruegeria sp. R8_1]MBO9415567.1 hypothetical protein [Ruegeria sp. R8_2]